MYLVLVAALIAVVIWLRETAAFVLPVVLLAAVGLLLVWRGLFGDGSEGQARRSTQSVLVGAVLLLLSAYPLAIIVGWYLWDRDYKATGAAAAKSLNLSIDQHRIGPDWLVQRLPKGYARFFQRHRITRAVTKPDSGLAQCAQLPDLLYIQATGPMITDAELTHLQHLSQLEEVDLTGAELTGSGLAQLQGLTQLENLSLVGTPVTDAGLEPLQRLSGLVRLDLSNTALTDAALAHLKGLSKLERLDVRMTHVSSQGVAALKEALPGLKNVKRIPARGTFALPPAPEPDDPAGQPPALAGPPTLNPDEPQAEPPPEPWVLVAVTRWHLELTSGDEAELRRLLQTTGTEWEIGSGGRRLPMDVRARESDAQTCRTAIDQAIAAGKLPETRLATPDTGWILTLTFPHDDLTYDRVLTLFDRNDVLLYTTTASPDAIGLAIYVDPSQVEQAVALLEGEIAAGNLPDARLHRPKPRQSPKPQNQSDPT